MAIFCAVKIKTRVTDPHSFHPDPDQHFRLNTDPDPIRIQGFNDQKLEKFKAEKKFNLI
jgi:hypothetical protein